MSAEAAKPTAPAPRGKRVTDTGMTVQFEEITPKVAKEMLELNHSNRNVRDGRVSALTRDIEADNWRGTHQGIAFDTTGKLIDGQHRLWAIVRAEKPAVLMVTRGVPVESFDSIDVGITRTLGDALNWGGYQNRAVLAAIIKMHGHYARESIIANYGKTISNAELLDHFERDEEHFITAARLATAWTKNLISPGKVVGTAYMIFSAIDEKAALEFFEAMLNLQTDGPGDPRLALTQRLRAKVKNRENIPAPLELNMWVKAWNNWRTGTPTTKIQVDRLRTKKVLEAV